MESNTDITYNRLLPNHDDERVYLNLEELKPQQLNDLGIINHHLPQPIIQQVHLQHQQLLVHRLTNQPLSQPHHAEPEPIYYDLNSQNISE